MTDMEWLEHAILDWHEYYNELPHWHKNVITDSYSMQLLGCEIVLCDNGHWYMNDTSGG
jgi:hypothetical protein